MPVITNLIQPPYAEDRYRQEAHIFKNGGAASVSHLGLPAAPTLTGTFTSQDTNAGKSGRHATPATNNSVTGFISPSFTVVRSQWETEFVTTVKLSGIDGYQLCAGLFSANPDAHNWAEPSVAPAQHFVGFATSNPNFGGPNNYRWNWCTVTCDGLFKTTEFTNISTLGGGEFKLRAKFGTYLNDVFLPTFGVQFFINESLVKTHFINLPNAPLGYGVRLRNVAAIANNFEWNRFSMYHTGKIGV